MKTLYHHSFDWVITGDVKSTKTQYLSEWRTSDKNCHCIATNVQGEYVMDSVHWFLCVPESLDFFSPVQLHIEPLEREGLCFVDRQPIIGQIVPQAPAQ